MGTIELQGLKIAYEREGSGPPLVLLHGGFGFSARSWHRQLDSLSDEFTVVAWDAPGCGRSSDPPKSFRLSDYADCLAGFIAALGLDRPHVLGLSFGGALALEFYRRHPARPKTLILAGAYAGWAGSLPAEVVEQRLRDLSRLSELAPDEWVHDYVPGMLTASAPPDMVEEVVAMMSEVRPVGNRVMLRALAESDLRDVLPRILVPTLLLHGDLDVRSPLRIGRELHEQIPESTLVVLSGVGHLSNVEAADRFDWEVRTFLRSHAG